MRRVSCRFGDDCLMETCGLPTKSIVLLQQPSYRERMKRYPLKVLLGALAVESSSCFVPNSSSRAPPSCGTRTFGSLLPLYSSSVDASSLLNDDAIMSAYNEWRNKYRKEDFDPVRYQNFENNYKILTSANINARDKALAEGRTPPFWLDLNEYGDYSREEYAAMKRGEPLRTTSQPTPREDSPDVSNGTEPVKSTQEIQAPQPAPQTTPEPAGTEDIQRPNLLQPPRSTQIIPTYPSSGATGSRNPTWGTQVPTNPMSGATGNPNLTLGTQVIRKNEPSRGTQVIQRAPEQEPTRPTQVIQKAPEQPPVRGTQVIQQAPPQQPVRGTQVVQRAPEQQPVRGTQVIQQAPEQPPVRGTQVIQQAPPQQPVRGTQVIRQAPEPPLERGTQVVQRAPEQQPIRGTQVIQQAAKQPPVRGTQVIQQAPPQQPVRGTQVIRQAPEQPLVRGTQVIQQTPRQQPISGAEVVQQASEQPPTWKNDVTEPTPAQQPARGTQVIRPSASSNGEGQRGTVVIPRPNGERMADRGTTMIDSPNPTSSDPSVNFFDGGMQLFRQVSFEGGTQVIRQTGQRAASFFSLFGGPKTAEEPPPSVQGTIKVGGRENTVLTSTDGRPDTVLVEKSDLQEIIPSIFSFFGLTKKANEETEIEAEPAPKPVTTTPSARPSLVIEKNSLQFPDTTNLPEIRRWWQNSDGSMTGFIYNSKNFNDGTKLTTSSLQRGACKIGNVVRSGGQEYLLK